MLKYRGMYAGIEPLVTLHHWDLPQALEEQYNGWLDPKIIKDSANYAETCFKMFGDRVKYWTTFNEPDTFTVQGYDVGLEAPGHCSILFHLFCKVGSSTTEPYIVAHNVLLSHATAADIYRKGDKDDDVNVLLSPQSMDDLNNPFLPALKDENRIEFHNDYLTNVLAAIM
ncbi:hypothetical protein GOBAR_DD30575 [Gossypium barbadense]|nr:hypothetical protein GOBAR_DD30575 [Gossypium barbadense]